MNARRAGLLAALAAVGLTRVLGLGRLAGIAAALLAMVAVLVAGWAFRVRRRRPADGGFEYVFVEDDGSARELASDEREYLQAEHHPADGGRPYVKDGYEARTPDGRLGGYLRRVRLPRHVPIRPAPPEPARPGDPAR
ncbi:MAG TPA: hypothetical protein VF142_10785 [Longimicrobium sp.]